ncbi:hypothetical protein [Pollutimonas subterranea]|nr:hypothetical protein [Pollutimonas subterranea]
MNRIGLRCVFAIKCMSLVVLSGQACATPLVATGHEVEARLATLAVKQFQWERYQAMQLSGMPSYVKSFASDLPAVESARTLAAHTDIFQRVLTLKNKIVLSGLQPGWHWLAEIEPAPPGSRGYVSALHVEAAGSNTADTGIVGSFRWLPPSATRKFSLKSDAKPHTVTQQVYSIALDPDELFAYVERGLRGEGWASEPALTARGSSAWRRGDARLMLFPQASMAGTSLFVHYVE